MTAPTVPNPKRIYVYEMMARLGIVPGGGIVPCLSLRSATALHNCEACPSKKACREWLDSMPTSLALAPRFCPNADVCFELQVDQPWLNRAGLQKVGHGDVTYVASK
jgi:Family of unknown function (DUF6455)